MKRIWEKLINYKNKASQPDVVFQSKNGNINIVEIKNHIDPRIIERGAEDFAVRFEGVMKELANG